MLVPAFGLSRLLEGEFGLMCVQGAHAPLFPPPRAERRSHVPGGLVGLPWGKAEINQPVCRLKTFP